MRAGNEAIGSFSDRLLEDITTINKMELVLYIGRYVYLPLHLISMMLPMNTHHYFHLNTNLMMKMKLEKDTPAEMKIY